MITETELNEWFALREQWINGGLSYQDYDYRELIRLNHLVMEASHTIHNRNMMGHGNGLTLDEKRELTLKLSLTP